jgi:hypothetical protein
MINILYGVHASATHVAILREMRCRQWIERYDTEVLNPRTHFFPFNMVTECILSACIIRYTQFNQSKISICTLKFNMYEYIEPCIFKTQYFTLAHWFTNTQYVEVSTICNAPTGGWPHAWPQHVSGIRSTLRTFIHLRTFVVFDITCRCSVQFRHRYIFNQTDKLTALQRNIRGTRWRSG